jgi:hypothetical protein
MLTSGTYVTLKEGSEQASRDLIGAFLIHTARRLVELEQNMRRAAADVAADEKKPV